MGFLKKLPRFIRPPKAVRKELEKFKGIDVAAALGVPGAATAKEVNDKIKERMKKNKSGGVGGAIGDIINNAGQTINTVRESANKVADNSAKAERNTTVIKWALIAMAVVFAYVFIFKKRG